MIDFHDPDAILFQDLISEVIPVFIKMMPCVGLPFGE